MVTRGAGAPQDRGRHGGGGPGQFAGAGGLHQPPPTVLPPSQGNPYAAYKVTPMACTPPLGWNTTGAEAGMLPAPCGTVPLGWSGGCPPLPPQPLAPAAGGGGWLLNGETQVQVAPQYPPVSQLLGMGMAPYQQPPVETYVYVHETTAAGSTPPKQKQQQQSQPQQSRSATGRTQPRRRKAKGYYSKAPPARDVFITPIEQTNDPQFWAVHAAKVAVLALLRALFQQAAGRRRDTAAHAPLPTSPFPDSDRDTNAEGYSSGSGDAQESDELEEEVMSALVAQGLDAMPLGRRGKGGERAALTKAARRRRAEWAEHVSAASAASTSVHGSPSGMSSPLQQHPHPIPSCTVGPPAKPTVDNPLSTSFGVPISVPRADTFAPSDDYCPYQCPSMSIECFRQSTRTASSVAPPPQLLSAAELSIGSSGPSQGAPEPASQGAPHGSALNSQESCRLTSLTCSDFQQRASTTPTIDRDETTPSHSPRTARLNSAPPGTFDALDSASTENMLATPSSSATRDPNPLPPTTSWQLSSPPRREVGEVARGGEQSDDTTHHNGTPIPVSSPLPPAAEGTGGSQQETPSVNDAARSDGGTPRAFRARTAGARLVLFQPEDDDVNGSFPRSHSEDNLAWSI